ncbi:MAG: hypothetical protein Q7U71_03400 [bacterium]|nr:hypothetical protein [bacterium]
MNKLQLSELSREEYERTYTLVKSYLGGQKSASNKVLRYSNVFKQLQTGSTLYLQGFNPEVILPSIPFYQNILVGICGGCRCLRNPEVLIPFLDSGAIIPVLGAPYELLGEKACAIFLRYPHFSVYEFSSYRYINLHKGEYGSFLCGHCAEQFISGIEKCVKDNKASTIIDRKAKLISMNLRPFLQPDFELLDHTRKAIHAKQWTTFEQIYNLSYAIREIRTCQALNSALPITSRVAQSDLDLFNLGKKTFPLQTVSQTPYLLLDSIGLYMPQDIRVDKYIDILLSNRAKILKLTHSMLTDNKASQLGKNVFEQIAILNEQILRAKKSTRHQVIHFIGNTIVNNKTVVLGVLAAAALGLTGNIVGCSATAIAGFVPKLLNGKIKINIDDKTYKSIKNDLKHKLSPVSNFIASKYYGISLRATQIWTIQNEISQKY